jgi:spore maturation protein CgeB
VYHPAPLEQRFACLLGYMGTYAADRQPQLEALLIETARHYPAERFIIAGAQYPPMQLPPNVRHEIHLYPRDHPAFYSSNVATLNLTRAAMRRYGWSPASRLFEAAACGACIISDSWPGLEEVLTPGTELLLAETRAAVEAHLEALTPARRAAIGDAARARVLREHTFAHRAAQVEAALASLIGAGA